MVEQIYSKSNFVVLVKVEQNLLSGKFPDYPLSFFLPLRWDLRFAWTWGWSNSWIYLLTNIFSLPNPATVLIFVIASMASWKKNNKPVFFKKKTELFLFNFSIFKKICTGEIKGSVYHLYGTLVFFKIKMHLRFWKDQIILGI